MAHIEHFDGSCPKCYSLEFIPLGASMDEDSNIIIWMKCMDCETQWKEEYIFAHAETAEPGEERGVTFVI